MRLSLVKNLRIMLLFVWIVRTAFIKTPIYTPMPSEATLAQAYYTLVCPPPARSYSQPSPYNRWVGFGFIGVASMGLDPRVVHNAPPLCLLGHSHPTLEGRGVSPARIYPMVGIF